MPYNNMFPVGYQPATNYFQQPPMQYPYPAPPAPVPQPQSVPTSGSFQNGNNQPMQQPTPQMMTPPTIHAEIVQIDGEAAIAQFPVNAGASQMMMAKDDSFIAVKSMLANGQFTVDIYDKRPPAPPEPTFDPSAYVRRDEIDGLVAAAVAAVQPTKRAGKKDEAEG